MKLTIEKIKLIIHEQFPEYDNLEIRMVKQSGHDNQSYHLGNRLSLRFPSAEEYSTQVIKEYKYCKMLQIKISIPITKPIALGIPSKYFPYHFSINQWIEGDTVTHTNVDKNQLAVDLAHFLHDLHKCDTQEGPQPGKHNFYRGGLLSVYHDETIQAIRNCVDFDKDKCLSIWMKGINSEYKDKPVWIHGDLEVGNILVRKSKLVAVIDFGNMAIGDPACDVVMAWTYFDQRSRKIFLNTLNLDTQTIDRARSWALWKALITLDDPLRRESALFTLNALIDDK